MVGPLKHQLTGFAVWEGPIPAASRFHQQLDGSGAGTFQTSNTLPCFKATLGRGRTRPLVWIGMLR